MMPHRDEARHNAVAAAQEWLGTAGSTGERVLLIEDVLGRIRLVVWADAGRRQLLEALVRKATTEGDGTGYWSGDVWSGGEAPEPEREVYEAFWSRAMEIVPDRIRLGNRYREREGWFMPAENGPWPITRHGRAPVVAFYSFKGGVGRSTALAAFALQRARSGERVVVVDADLDAPGLGALLPADRQGGTQRWGVVDYLLERPLRPVDLGDDDHAFRDEEAVGSGEVLVVPAGRLDQDYLGKLARVDWEPSGTADKPAPLRRLLDDLSTQLHPQWILVDARSGFSDPAGVVLAGLAHLHVLLGTSSAQSWAGLALVLERIGAERVRRGRPRADCVLVHAMVPRTTALAQQSKVDFANQARQLFEEHDDAEDGSGEDFWTVGDAEVSDAPHVSVPLSYDEKLASFAYIGQVTPVLLGDEYRQLGERIRGRCGGDG